MLFRSVFDCKITDSDQFFLPLRGVDGVKLLRLDKSGELSPETQTRLFRRSSSRSSRPGTCGWVTMSPNLANLVKLSLRGVEARRSRDSRSGGRRTCGLADARLEPAEFASLPSAAAFRQGGGLNVLLARLQGGGLTTAAGVVVVGVVVPVVPPPPPLDEFAFLRSPSASAAAGFVVSPLFDFS